MSEKIKITIVMDDEKQYSEKMPQSGSELVLTQDPSVTLMSLLLENRLLSGSFCGGRGDCGRCVVQFLEGAPLPTALERSRLEPEELRQGFRLACVTRPKVDCVIRMAEPEEREIPIVTEVNLLSENIDLSSQRNKQSENQTSVAMESVEKQRTTDENGDKSASVISEKRADVMIAVDLGTTTIAMQLRNMVTGEVMDTYCEKNPQRCYGADVLSRIQASCEGHGQELRRLVCETLARGLRQFAAYLSGATGEERAASGENAAANAKRPICMCIAGNTTMEHLLLGYDVATLGRNPFTPVEIGLQEIPVSRLFAEDGEESVGTQAASLPPGWDFPVYIAPGISVFVGGDIVAGLYALRMLPEDSIKEGANAKLHGDMEARKECKRETVLLIDLGTNGELAITDGRRMLVTATAAGPAFEGGGDSALIGTDRIAFTAKLLKQGVLDETGLLAEPYFTEGVCLEAKQGDEADTGRQTRASYFKNEDIRALQMAKAAVRAGVEILWEEMGRPEIDRVYLAGGFGYYLDVEAALAIGLLPERLRGRVRAVGNTSLEGAFLLGRVFVQGELTKSGLESLLSDGEGRSLRSVNLAKQEGFEGLYLKYMNLERN